MSAFDTASSRPGVDGDDGISPEFSIGTVESVGADGPPTVTITGTQAAPVLNFGLQRGATGASVHATLDVRAIKT